MTKCHSAVPQQASPEYPLVMTTAIARAVQCLSQEASPTLDHASHDRRMLLSQFFIGAMAAISANLLNFTNTTHNIKILQKLKRNSKLEVSSLK